MIQFHINSTSIFFFLLEEKTKANLDFSVYKSKTRMSITHLNGDYLFSVLQSNNYIHCDQK